MTPDERAPSEIQQKEWELQTKLLEVVARDPDIRFRFADNPKQTLEEAGLNGLAEEVEKLRRAQLEQAEVAGHSQPGYHTAGSAAATCTYSFTYCCC